MPMHASSKAKPAKMPNNSKRKRCRSSVPLASCSKVSGRRSAAEGKGAQGDNRKPGLLPQGAKRISEVLPQVLQPACAAGVAATLLHLLAAAESKPGLSSCFLRIVAMRDQIARVLVEM